MISPAKTLLTVMLVLSAATLAIARPAAAATSAATPCWKALLNDWYDGRIDHTYAIHCYRDALKQLPADVKQYSSAHDDIERALQSAIAKKTKAGEKVNGNTQIPPPSSGTGTTTTTAVSLTTGKTQTITKPPDGSGPSGSGPGVGRKQPKGGIGIVERLTPGSADALPLPLLVLGALAILLVAAGAAGLVAKRLKTRGTGH